MKIITDTASLFSVEEGKKNDIFGDPYRKNFERMLKHEENKISWM